MTDSQPQSLGLAMWTVESAKPDDEQPLTWFFMGDMIYDNTLLAAFVRRGMSPAYVAGLLRRLAGVIERHGRELLNADAGVLGIIDTNGDPVNDRLPPEDVSRTDFPSCEP